MVVSYQLTCKHCSSTFLHANFMRRVCGDCLEKQGKISRKNWKQKHPYKGSQAQRKHSVKKKYNLTEAEYDEKLRQQGYTCAICGADISQAGRAQLDHNHSTGKIRDFLCGNCNTGLGLFKDNLDFLRQAERYLEGHL